MDMSRTNLLTLTAYVLLIVILTGGMFVARTQVVEHQSVSLSQDEWQEWRREAARQSEGQGPVTRRMPTAEEPPTLMLMRDHFGACLTLALVISTVLFATLAFMIRGVLFGPKLQLQQESEQRRER